MVNWSLLQNATSPDNRPTPGWLFHEICVDVKNDPMNSSDVAEYLMQCVCSDHLNIQLKAVLCIRHLSREVITFQRYMQSCQGALKILTEIASPPIVPQARSLESAEVKTVREATQAAIDAVSTPHTVETQTESAYLKERIQGFGNFQPPPDDSDGKQTGVTGQVAEFVGDSIGDMVEDFREKGAVIALKDATVDALDLVLDGVDSAWGWIVGKDNSQAHRICQPQHLPANGLAPSRYQQSPGAFMPPPLLAPTSASSHYAAAFGGAVVGANNPFMISSPTGVTAPGRPPVYDRKAQADACSQCGTACVVDGKFCSGCGSALNPEDLRPISAPTAPQSVPSEPEPMVDLICMDEPPKPSEKMPVSPEVPDLPGEREFAPSSGESASQDLLDF